MAANHSCPATIWKILAWCLLGLVLAPALTFGLTSSVSWSALWQQIWNDPVIHGSLRRSLTVLGWTWGIGFAMGWPLGAALTLARPRVRTLAWTWLAPGLLCPPFLWAAGLQGWKAVLPYNLHSWLDGRSGLVLSLGLQTAVMVAVLTGTLAGWIAVAEREACLLIQGRRLLARVALRRSLPAALALSLALSLLLLGDAGAPQLMGHHTFASEVHIAFASAQPERAALRLLTACSVLALPAIAAACLLASVTKKTLVIAPSRSVAMNEGGSLSSTLTLIPCIALSAIALVGLIMPLFGSPGASTHLWDALTVLAESAPVTLHFAFTSALIILVLAGPLIFVASRSAALLKCCLIVQLLLLAAPPQLYADGFRQLSALLGSTGWLESGQAALVGACASLRLLPFAVIVGVIWFNSIPKSWTESAQMAGVSTMSYARHVLLPVAWGPMSLLALSVVMLDLADVSGAVLLQPPGWSSYPLRLFALMDNALAAQAAALCFIYWIAAFTLPLCFHVAAWIISKIRALRSES